MKSQKKERPSILLRAAAKDNGDVSDIALSALSVISDRILPESEAC
ncbi:hypothetical protein ACTUSR_17215 [Pantoea stewartii subsp. indologenes]|nr:hypothetical protein [Pantoea stewartii]